MDSFTEMAIVDFIENVALFKDILSMILGAMNMNNKYENIGSKPKLLIVNDNMNIGGIQKSMLNLLNAIHEKYDVSLLLLNPNGKYMNEIPSNINMVYANRLLMIFGASKEELKAKPLSYIWKGICKILLRITSKDNLLKILFLFQKKISGFDQAISFTHPAVDGELRACSAEFVLSAVEATQKICYLHCDYGASHMRDSYTDKVLRQFQKIACCSNSVREQLITQMPELESKAFTVRNFYDLSIKYKKTMTKTNFDSNMINIVSIARLSEEKGIARAVDILGKIKRENIVYYIIGDGPQKEKLRKMISSYKAQDRIILLGEIINPYPYLNDADYLLVPSYHEAAPMVFDEANIVGTHIIATNTLSAKEMIEDGESIVCENTDDAIEDILINLVKPSNRTKRVNNNDMQLQQLAYLLLE